MTELPPLYRAAICTSLEDHGVEHPRVEKNGRITEILPLQEGGKRDRTPLYDPDCTFLVQAVVEADVMVGILTGETLSRGKALLQALGVDDWEVLYEKHREIAIGHGVSSMALRDTLARARDMIGTSRRSIKNSSRNAAIPDKSSRQGGRRCGSLLRPPAEIAARASHKP